MTRENKLALVVGFALILLVGIAISDHFSPAQNRESATLTGAVDDLSRNGAVSRRDLMAAEHSRTTRFVEPPAPEPNIVGFPPGHGGDAEDELDRRRDPAPRNESRDDAPLDDVTPPARGIEIGVPLHRPGPSERADETTVTVKPNQTLTHICRDHYRDATLIEALAAYNGISDPGLIRAGATIRLPDRSALTGAPAPDRTPPSNATTPTTPQYRSHTVRANENLSSIAKKYLRSERRYTEIYELNRDILRDPNSVREGMVLKIPSS